MDEVFSLFLTDIQRLSPNAVRSETPLNSKEYKASLFAAVLICGITTDMATSASKPLGIMGRFISIVYRFTTETWVSGLTT